MTKPIVLHIPCSARNIVMTKPIVLHIPCCGLLEKLSCKGPVECAPLHKMSCLPEGALVSVWVCSVTVRSHPIRHHYCQGRP